MKNMNKQFGRIKQLFTEERLYGNLVDSKEVLEEQLFDKERRKANKEDRKEKRSDMKAARKEKITDIKAAKDKFKSSKDDIKKDLKQDLEQNKQKSKSTEGPTEEPQTASVEQPKPEAKPKAKAGGGIGKSGKAGDSKDVLKDKEPKKLDGSRLQKGFDYVIDNNKDVYKINKKTGKIDTVYTFNESFDKSLLFKSVLSEDWNKLVKEAYYTVQTSEGPKKMSDTFTKIASNAFDGGVVDIDKVGVTITLPFKNTEEGNAFRQWVNDTYPDKAKKLNLDSTGSFNNSYIQKAFEELGEEYQESLKTPENTETPEETSSEESSDESSEESSDESSEEESSEESSEEESSEETPDTETGNDTIIDKFLEDNPQHGEITQDQFEKKESGYEDFQKVEDSNNNLHYYAIQISSA